MDGKKPGQSGYLENICWINFKIKNLSELIFKNLNVQINK